MFSVIRFEFDGPSFACRDLVPRRTPFEIGALGATRLEGRSSGQGCARSNVDAQAIVISDFDIEAHAWIARQIVSSSGARSKEHGRRIARREDLDDDSLAIEELSRRRGDLEDEFVSAHVTRQGSPPELSGGR